MACRTVTDTSEALVLVAESDVAILDMTLGQRKLLTKAIGELWKDSEPGPGAATLKLKGTDSTPVTTKSLVEDEGLEKTLKKIEGIGALLALGATQSTMLCVDNDPQVFSEAILKANRWQGRWEALFNTRLCKGAPLIAKPTR